MSKKSSSVKLKFLVYIRKFNYTGLLLASALFCFSMLPSILPRPWLMQGLISGISLAVGYGLGVLTSKALRWFFQKEFTKKTKTSAWKIVYVLPLIMLVFVILGHNWQNEVRELVGQSPSTSLNILQILITALLVFSAIIGVSRAIRKLSRRISRFLSQWIPRRIGVLLGVSMTMLLVVWIVNGFILKSFIAVANDIYSASNDKTSDGISQPKNPERSGSPKSLVSWDSLGSRGRDFVARGPSQQKLEEFSGKKPVEQIRVYVGVKSADTARERAKLALQELKRTGAFNRDVLILATATGSGWLEPQSVDSIEYMYNGNSAIVSQQYSYLPSWISFLVDSENAIDAGRELYDAVYSEWSTLPVNSRPKLIAYGLSLGSFGGNSAYSSAQDIRRSVDGALFLGTPSNTELWRSITDNRDPGSPEVKPVYDNGQNIRFASEQNDITTNPESWKFPRTLYMQHASDPVVWWSYDLLLHQPDRLSEDRGSDVSPKTRWIPFVTFFQATVDQFYGVTVPNGHGHNYPNNIVRAWASVAPPENWKESDSNRLQTIIDGYVNE